MGHPVAAVSGFAHGLTAWPGANRYADWDQRAALEHAHPDRAAAASDGSPVEAVRARFERSPRAGETAPDR
jgi:hypothetical protein